MPINEKIKALVIKKYSLIEEKEAEYFEKKIENCLINRDSFIDENHKLSLLFFYVIL